MTRILIAEPSKTLAALVKLSLADLGAELDVAHDGAAALAIARNRLPDALVADQALPGLDGYALAHGVRQLAGERRIPTLLLVSEHMPADQERLAWVGIHDVLQKPFERAVLLERVRTMLESSLPPALRAPYPGSSSAASTGPATAPQADPRTSAGRATTERDLPRPVDLGPQIESEVRAQLTPILAQKLPGILDAALQRLLPAHLQAIAEQAIAERVPGLVEAAVRRALAEQLTPTTIARMVADEARGALGDAAARVEGRLEQELVARLDVFARDVLPGRLQAHAEQVVWKVVPTIAEDLVKDEIKRLTAEPA